MFYYADELGISWHPTIKAIDHQGHVDAQRQADHDPNAGAAYLVWDNAFTHRDDEIDAVVRGAAGRLVLLYLPTYSPHHRCFLNPIEMPWRHFRREVTHCELFETVKALTVKALVEVSLDFFRRYNEIPEKVLSIIGAKPQLST